MIDAKEIGRRIAERIRDDFVAPSVERSSQIAAEEIDKAQNSKPKTRGEIAAWHAIYIHPNGKAVVIGDSPPIILSQSSDRIELANARDTLRYAFAKLIDAEREAAKKEEREECLDIAERLVGGDPWGIIAALRNRQEVNITVESKPK